jgi:hypothetical protein
MVCDLMVFCPNGAQGDSPGQRPGFDGPESYQALKGRNPRRGNQCADVPRAALRFALGYLILPLWGGGRSMVDPTPPRVFCHNRTGHDNSPPAI